MDGINDLEAYRVNSHIIPADHDLQPRDGRRWLVLAVLVVAQFMVVLDVAIVNVALPTIKNDLHFSQESLQWVITAYSILFGGVLLLGGRTADLLGRRRLFMLGLALFTVMPSRPSRKAVLATSSRGRQNCGAPGGRFTGISVAQPIVCDIYRGV